MRPKSRSPFDHFVVISAAVLTLSTSLVAGSPRPAPAAAPAAEALPAPTPVANPIADPLAYPVPEAQTYNTYAPFSGAIYIVGAGGAPLSAAVPAQCPAAAGSYQGCANINVWNWCCPAGNTCSMLANNVVGCCPSGASCSGNVNQAQITTVTVTTTVVQQAANTVAGVVVGSGSGTTTKNTPVYNGYCSTLRMQGNPIPTTAAGACGTILIVNAGVELRAGWRVWMLLAGFHGVLGIVGSFGLLRT